MLLREKINLVVPGQSSGRASFSALRDLSGKLLAIEPSQSNEAPITLARLFDERSHSPELHSLIETLKPIRARILANSVLQAWVKWFGWIVVVLAAVAAVSSKLAEPLFVVAVIALVGAIGILAAIWRDRPSHYEVARRLDFAAGLKDRLSTAIFLGGIQNPDGIVGEQRKDALERLGKFDRRVLFPFKWPGNGKRAAALVLLVAGLFAYRIRHQAPLISLLQSTAHSQLLQSILAPIARAVEKDIQRTIAMVTAKPDSVGEDAQRAGEAATEDLWKTDEKSDTGDQQKNAADAGNQPPDQVQPPGDQEGTPSADGRQQDGNSQQQESNNGNESSDGKTQEQSEQAGPQGKQSASQSLMQALKNMMSKSPSQQSSNGRPNQQPPNSQGSPQSGNSNQPGAPETDKRGDSKGNSDAKQKASQTASEGAGSQQGTKDLRTDMELHPLNAVPDRVALESSGFKEQTRMKVATETGTAQMPIRDQGTQQDAVTNGSEQENIPARYRFYVQRYFEHAGNAK
ncbi:MAG TPA: hypothetical protein VFE02_01035 [Candidatus Acidoferrales bacterium]|nr:hypothetical protein [Candidatus Acidoferrales bacterium]